jgi:hypothetical protein
LVEFSQASDKRGQKFLIKLSSRKFTNFKGAAALLTAKEKGLPLGQPSLLRNVSDYACSGAETGQVSAQAPHSMQVSASISYLPSPSEIAETGHASAQAPQAMQASVILYAILGHLHVFDTYILTQIHENASENCFFTDT